jgi:hypothetical protein
MVMASGTEARTGRHAQFAAAAMAVLLAPGCARVEPERPGAAAARTAAAGMHGGGEGPDGARDATGAGFVSPDGEFSIALPEAPRALRTPDGRAVYQLSAGGHAYTVNELDCPADFTGDVDPDPLYDAIQAASVRAVGGTLQSQRDVTSTGEHVAGREFVVHAVTPRTGDAYEMLVRLFRVGDAVYLVQAIGPRTDSAREERQAVVESFAVL